MQMDVEQPVQQRRAAGDVFGAPAVVTRVMAYCATLEDVSRLSRTCRGAARPICDLALVTPSLLANAASDGLSDD